MSMIQKFSILALGACLTLSVAQATDYTSYESYANLPNNEEGSTEGLFFIRYDPIDPAVVGYGGAARYSSARSAAPGAASGEFEYVAFAKEFMAQHSNMLNVDSGHDFTLIRENEDSRGGRHLRFYRTYRGIRLDNMEVIVHFNPQRQINGINGEVVRLPAEVQAAVDQHLAGGSTVATEAALKAAVAASENLAVDKIKVKDPVPLISKQAPHVIWKLVAVLDDNIMENYTYTLSDTSSPSVLSKNSNIRH